VLNHQPEPPIGRVELEPFVFEVGFILLNCFEDGVLRISRMEYGGYRTVKNVCFPTRGEQVKCSGIRIDDTIINTDEDGVGRSFENRFGPFLRAGCLFTKSVAANRVTDTCGKHFVLVSSCSFCI